MKQSIARMESYGFSLKFILPKGQRIIGCSKSLSLHIHSCKIPLVLKALDAGKIEQADSLTLVGSGFSSEREAKKHGLNLKQALLIVGTILRMGINPGKEELKGIVGQAIKLRAKEVGYNLLDDLHGLCVYDEKIPVSFASPKSHIIAGPKSKLFIDKLIEIYDCNYQLSEKQTLALELYNLSHFEFSPRARFLTLIIAVEVLSKRERLPNRELEHLEKLINLAEEADSYVQLVKSLKNLKRESISRACNILVENHLRNKSAKQFKRFYNIRSKMLHNGKVPKGVNLSIAIPPLDQLVSGLIVKDIEENRTIRKAGEISKE